MNKKITTHVEEIVQSGLTFDPLCVTVAKIERTQHRSSGNPSVRAGARRMTDDGDAKRDAHVTNGAAEMAKRAARDRARVERTLDGDNGAFSELVAAYQRRVYALAFGILKNRDDAWDAAQDAFVKAYRNLATFEGSGSFYTWLYRITYHLCLDVLRARARRKTESLDDREPTHTARLAHTEHDTDHPSAVVERKQLGEAIRVAMFGLSEKHRAIIVLREVEELSYEEIAEILEISKGTVMSRLFHARRNQEALLRPYLDDAANPSPAGGTP